MAKTDTRRITLGGVEFPVRFLCSATPVLYFLPFQNRAGQLAHPETVSLPVEALRRSMAEFGSESFAEYNLLLGRFASLLLPYGRCLFHGVALAVGDRAYLLTGPSGVGKTTQYRLWKQLFGDGVRLICGDKPILEFREDGDILVHPSPWMGKERLPGGRAARLAGIVCLEQGPGNSIAPLPVSRAVVPLYTQFLYEPAAEAELRQTAAMLDRLLRAVPVWRLVNVGDEASARLTHDTLCGKENV